MPASVKQQSVAMQSRKLADWGRFFSRHLLAKLLKVAEKEPSPIRQLVIGMVLWWMGAWAVVSPQQVAYDHYFDAATFAIEAQASADTVAYWLVMTYDEGRISVPRGSQLLIHLRDRSVITLATDREVGKRDVLLRRWRNRTNQYIRCYYPITLAQLGRILDKDIYKLEISTARGIIVRRTRNFKSKLSTALTSVATD